MYGMDVADCIPISFQQAGMDRHESRRDSRRRLADGGTQLMDVGGELKVFGLLYFSAVRSSFQGKLLVNASRGHLSLSYTC
jgi:hypothetical protein